MNDQTLTVYTDGGARGNPGPAAIGVVVLNGKELVTEFGKVIGATTNNVAEYEAVVAALTFIKERGIPVTKINFLLDSQLVVNQIKGVYKVTKPHLRDLLNRVRALERQVGAEVEYRSIPRAQNTRADHLVNRSLDQAL
jgi:ribonuclease HI